MRHTKYPNMTSLHLTDAQFESEVLKSEVPVLVDFWADWCQPCKMVDPVVEELAGEYGAKLKVAKMNVDENTEVPGNFGIMSIPTLIIFKNGVPAKTMVGVQGKDQLKSAIDEAIN